MTSAATLGLAVGLITGQAMALPHALATSLHGPWPGVNTAAVPWSGVLLIALILLAWWIARSALAWLPQEGRR
ncbi:hypothetical protein GCM10018779_10990 [Streptomyces griseocarneus]|nr:hypothetical protein GCM10018779_10990 [Streptomyces griseocarneus]